MKSLKMGLCVMLILSMFLGLTACGAAKEETSAAGSAEEENTSAAGTAENEGTHVIVDHAGKEVEIPYEIDRIAVCDIYPMTSVLTVFFDSASKLKGIAPPSMSAAKNGLLGELYPEVLEAETGFIDGTNVNIEELLKLDPDICFYSAGSPEEGALISEAGIPAVAISPAKWGFNAIETLSQWIALLDEIFPGNDRAERVRAYSEKVYERVNERVSGLAGNEKRRVFFLFQYSDTAIMSVGSPSFGQWWCDTIGAVNVSAEAGDQNAAAVSMEQIYAWDPDLIFITNFNTATPEDLYGNNVGNFDWSGIDAVDNKEVFKMPLGLYRTYTCGADTPVTLLWLAKAAYPELFDDIDITAETKAYYSEVFGVELTDEQADSIFDPITGAGDGIVIE